MRQILAALAAGLLLLARPAAAADETKIFDLYGEALTLIQAGGDTSGQGLLGAPTRLRVSLTANIVPDQLHFVSRLVAAAGSFSLGGGNLVPINLVGPVASAGNELNRPNVLLDKAHLQWRPQSNVEFELGLMNIFSHQMDGRGFDNNPATSEESRCFTSIHFIGAQAPKTFFASVTQSLYALTARYDPFDFLSIKAGLATTDLTNLVHLGKTTEESRAKAFNSGLLQLTGSFRPFGLEGHYRLGYGVTTRPTLAGEAFTPGNSGYFNFDQKLTQNLLVFGRYSLAEDNATTRAIPFDGIEQHLHFGVGWASGEGIPWIAEDYAALGFSAAKPFNPTGGPSANDTWEKVIELFWRHRVFERFNVTPDLQIVFHPKGKADAATQIIGTVRAFYEF